MKASDELILVVVTLVGTMGLASLLRVTLRSPGGQPRLDARGLLLFVPLLTLLVLGAPEPVLVPMLGGVGIYLLCAIGEVLGTARWVRIAAVLLTALLVYREGIAITSFKVPLMPVWVNLGALSPVVTAGWLWLCASLFGRAGSIPSVAYGVAGLSGLTFYLTCLLVPWATGPEARLLALAVAAVAAAQLPALGQVANRPANPSAYGLGFVIGALTILGALKHTAAIAMLLPILVLSVPLFGATFTHVIALRGRAHGLHIGQRRQHLHELLLEQGYSPEQVFHVLMGVTVYMCVLGLLLVLLMHWSPWLRLLLLVVGITVGPFVFFVILRMMRHELPLPAGEGPPALELFHVRLHPVTMEEALAQAERFIAEGGPHMIVTSDTSAVVRAQEDEELRTIINEADLATVDGQGVVLCARLLNLPISERVAGVDMMQHLCAVAARLGQPIALLGAAPGVAEAAAHKLQELYPGLRVVYTHHGYFTPEEERTIVEQIRCAQPAVLFVAMGIPKQEKWIKAHLQELGVPVCMGVGGSFDVLAGRVPRAPLWMRRCGLEWLYRTIREPRRLPRLAALPRMFLMTLHELLTAPDRVSGLTDRPGTGTSSQ